MKKGEERIKIRLHYNKKAVYWIIVLLIILGFILIYFSFKNNSIDDKNNLTDRGKIVKIIECNVDSDCVQSSCCHATSCGAKNMAKDCSQVFCTLDCSGPLDCGKGDCGCVNNKCIIVTK